jgi:hypothetical protein
MTGIAGIGRHPALAIPLLSEFSHPFRAKGLYQARNPLADHDVADFTDIIRDATPEQRAEILGYARGVKRR